MRYTTEKLDKKRLSPKKTSKETEENEETRVLKATPVVLRTIRPPGSAIGKIKIQNPGALWSNRVIGILAGVE